MFHRTPLAIALTVAFGGTAVVATPALAQSTSGTPQRIEITGSNVKRVDLETVSPVTVITREQIERTGQATVADALRNISSNAGSFGESFSNSFAPGAAGISLRGLGQKTTLVLLNGRRVAGYGFAQNLQDTFVDLNSIPTSAVERIDILRDGASAIYGSDAIAGVINIILRKDYRGAEASVQGGAFEGKKEYRATLTGGYGDIASQKFNVFGTLDLYKRDELLYNDSKFMASRDFREFAGGRNFTGLTTGGTWRQLSATGALTDNYRATTGCATGGGTVLTGPQAAQAGLINVGTNAAGAAVGTAANLRTAAATNTFCSFDQNSQLSALPATTRVGTIVRGTFELSATATAYAEVGLSRVKTEQTFTWPFFAGTTGLNRGAAGTLVPFTYNINFAPGVAGNPFPTNARYVGSLKDFGTRDAEVISDTLRTIAGVSYQVGSWDIDSAAGFSLTDVNALFTNRITLAGTSAAFGVPTTSQPPIPTSTSSTYNLDNPASNSQAVRDGIRINFDRNAKSKLWFFDTKGNTTIGKMEGGDVGLAIGAELRKEQLIDSPAAAAQNGNILGQGITSTNGQRKNYSGFAEVSLPFTKSFETQLALRHDSYSDYGSSTTPKIGAKWRPNDMILARANWGKGFRAPSLPEISPSVATFFTTVIDPQNGASTQVSGAFAGNPNLKAETSVSRTFGLVFEPMKDVNFGLDFYAIKWQNVVAAPSFQDIVDLACPNPPADPAVDPPCPSTNNVIRDPQTNAVALIFSNYQNLNTRKVSGFDFDWKIGMPTNHGKYTVRGDVNYVRSFKEDGVEVAGTNAGANTIPRIRGTFALDFDSGPWSFTGQARYTHSYYNSALDGSTFRSTALATSFQNGVYPARAGSYTLLDVFGRYDVTKNLKVSLSVANLLNKTPPYDPGFSTTALYDFSLHDVRGRQIRIGLSYKL
jgi:iron complex outermembrane recepter protein